MSKARLILDGRCLNKLTQKAVRFQLETVQRMRHIVQPGDWFTTFDISDAYNHLPVHPHSTAWFGFLGPFGSTCELAALPMGYRHSAYILHEVMRVPLGALRHVGVRISMFRLSAKRQSRRHSQSTAIPRTWIYHPRREVRHRADTTRATSRHLVRLGRDGVVAQRTVGGQSGHHGQHLFAQVQTLAQSAALTSSARASERSAYGGTSCSPEHEGAPASVDSLHHMVAAPPAHMGSTASSFARFCGSGPRPFETTRASAHAPQRHPDFILDTDASDWGLGAWLRKRRRRGRTHAEILFR
jgi:hypothetical protein